MTKNTLFVFAIGILLGVLIGQNWPHTVVSAQQVSARGEWVTATRMPGGVTCYVPTVSAGGIWCK